MPYTSLVLEKDWGRYYIASKHNGKELVFKEGQEVGIKWPSGKEETVTLSLRLIEDVFLRIPTKSKVPGFLYPVNGLEVWVDLFKVSVNEDDLL